MAPSMHPAAAIVNRAILPPSRLFDINAVRRRSGADSPPPGVQVPPSLTAILPIVLLIASNVFMTTAWYGHLKPPHAPMWAAVMVSWGNALVEYWLAVPANRNGYGTYSAAELKTIQEVISLTTWNHAIGFALIALGAFFIFKGPLR